LKRTDCRLLRRFPPPWSAEETDACCIVRDHNGQALAYVYFEDEPGRPSGGFIWPFRPRRRPADCSEHGAAIWSC
jgi:hypothetical protein